MRKQRRYFFFILTSLIFLCGSSSAQVFETQEYLSWQIITNPTETETPQPKFLMFSGASMTDHTLGTGEYIRSFEVEDFNEIKAFLEDEVYVDLSKAEEEAINYNAPAEITPEAVVRSAAGVPFATVRFVPLRRNSETGKMEKLVAFNLKVINLPGTAPKTHATTSRNKNGENSPLASGNWYKIGVTSDGIYKIDRDLLNKIGIDPATVDPRRIKIYGKAGGVLPQANSVERDEDVTENAIIVSGEADGRFDPGDHILFYARGPVTWTPDLNTKTFKRYPNHYCDTAYYFITGDGAIGKRISDRASEAGTPDNTVIGFNDHAWHDLEQLTEITKNIKGGRDWYGEEFRSNSAGPVTLQFNDFWFPHIDKETPARIAVNVAGKSTANATFNIKVNGTNVLNASQDAIRGSYPTDFAITAYITAQNGSKILPVADFTPVSDNVKVSITYNKPSADATAWLNYIEVTARRHLIFTSGQMEFKDMNSIDANTRYQYQLGNANSSIKIWDITDFHNIASQQYTLTGSNISFQVSQAETRLREYIAFDGSSFKTPSDFGRVPNQNLHALSQPDMIIIAHPEFLEAANDLANFHRQHDNFTVHVVTPRQVYNEFSYGMQDITAIRDFVRMFYKRAQDGGKKPGYLLLFGDASYDYKDRIPGNTNFVPTYQSINSIHPFQAYASDDYFGFLDDQEGAWDNGAGSSDKMDIAIGRLPVTTKTQAYDMVEKIKRYHAPEAMGDWRNIAAFVADDEDSNHYFNDAESVIDSYKNEYKPINTQKIYLDAYRQKASSGGNIYPDVNTTIKQRIENGTLIFNYIGHGHELGMAHEKIIDINDINGWSNKYQMPLFITATCELSRYDDPARTSAGELALLNKEGGAIALYSTSRVVYADGNRNLNINVVNDNLFRKEQGKGRRLGDIFLTAKNTSGFSSNTRNFILLGDPAVRLALPEYDVVVTSVNGDAPGLDTMKALSLITISGEVRSNGQKLNTFNGILNTTIYDKEATKYTLANDPASIPAAFKVRENVIYKGKASVKNGAFTFSFYVPKDISFQDGFGKISFYADNDAIDAGGYNTDIVIGGSSPDPIFDETGPEIQLFMNDTTFLRGGLVNQDPVLLAYVSDDYGINITGNGVGHDITAIFNETGDPIILNDHYEAQLDDYRKGIVRYPLFKLADGHYFVKVKVWDINNNSAEAFTDFIVANSAKFALDKIFNYPNPFSDKTYFSFEHNRPGEDLNVNIRIFDINGKMIKNLATVVNSGGNKVRDIEWNGLADNNTPITSGIYIYRIIVTSNDGQQVQHSERLVYIK